MNGPLCHNANDEIEDEHIYEKLGSLLYILGIQK